MKKLLLAALAVLAATALFAQDAKTAANEKVEKVEAITSIANTKGTKLYVVGDSTLSSFNDPYFYPRYGYGTKLQNYLNPKKIEVINLAMSGRSSKSFLTEANYQTLKNNIKKGDYLLIGFGHNDEKGETARYTNPNGSKEDAGSFKNSLYENYIKLALDKKATPILCTPIVRRSPGKAYEGSVVHITNDQGAEFPGGDYPKAIRELAAETGTTLIDLTAKTKALYESLGDAGTIKLHAWLKHNEKSVDNTHLNTYGATVVAKLVIDDLAAQNKNIKKILNKDAREPNEAVDLTQNPNYIIPKYEAFSVEDKSVNFTTTAPWFGTVFGDMGGEEKAANPEFYEIIETANGVSMHAGSKDAKSPQGKIAAASDGPLMYFRQLSADANFTLTATVKINAINEKNNQVAFGLMARDDIYIDKYDNAISSNYVAVGGLKLGKGDKFTSSWQRADGALTETQNAGSPLPVAGTTVKLSLKKNGNTYLVKYGNEPELSYTADLKAVDQYFIYVGLIAVRAANVEYSDIKLEVTR